jgi:lipoate-protein ligase A
MAVDEALLDDAAQRGVATLRFYRWSAPTLSLGYFQSLAERQSHAASRGAAVVRRLSGGGALLHDRELTYSLCLPEGHSLARQAPAVYDRMHRALIDALADRGVRAALWATAASQTEPSPAAAERRRRGAARFARRRLCKDRRQRPAPPSRGRSATRRRALGRVARGAGAAGAARSDRRRSRRSGTCPCLGDRRRT